MTTTELLNAAQAAAVTSTASQILTLAGPGSGKTRTLIERIRHLIDRGVPPSQMVAITFTNAAAAELTHRLSDGAPVTLGYVGTLHGFLLRLITRHWSLLGYASDKITVLAEEQAEELLERTMKELNCRASKKAVREAIQNGQIGTKPEQLAARRYYLTLRNNSLVTFDTILADGLRLAKGLALPYAHLFVDEFQDTSDMDAAIYQALNIPCKFFVGDGDQSIYKFRGSNVDNFLALARDPRTEVHYLEENYRSDWLICEAASKLIAHNENRMPKMVTSVSDQPGAIKAYAFRETTAEQLFVIRSLQLHVEAGDSVAVLCRSNALVDEWTAALSAHFPVIRRRMAQRPLDWPLVRAALAYLNDPANDWNAWLLLKEQHGQAKADDLRLKSSVAGRRLAEGIDTPPVSSLSEYGKALARFGVSGESVELVERAVSMLPADATAADLMLALAETDEHRPEEGEGIAVCTLHAAKGREWDVCVLPAFEDEVTPGTAKSRDIDEERRLAFVGITRARHRVIITHCSERKSPYGLPRPVPARPSRFIAEAGL